MEALASQDVDLLWPALGTLAKPPISRPGGVGASLSKMSEGESR